jgi:hypothetical protein
VNTGNTVDPLGTPSLDHAVDPPDANKRPPPLDTCIYNYNSSPQPSSTDAKE